MRIMLNTFQRVWMLGCFGLLVGTAVAADKLAAEFANPSNATRPGVWLRWIEGNINREGITRILKEMSRKGFRSADVSMTAAVSLPARRRDGFLYQRQHRADGAVKFPACCGMRTPGTRSGGCRSLKM